MLFLYTWMMCCLKVQLGDRIARLGNWLLFAVTGALKKSTQRLFSGQKRLIRLEMKQATDCQQTTNIRAE